MKCYICGHDFPPGAMHTIEFKGKELKYCDTCYKMASKSEEYFKKIDARTEKVNKGIIHENTDK